MKILKFSATWCQPCKALTKTLESLDIKVPIEHVDIDAQRDLVTKYGVRSVPTMIMVERGQEVRRVLGNQTKESVIEFLGAHA